MQKNKILLYNGIPTALVSSDDIPSLSLMAISAFLKEKGYRVELVFDRDSPGQLKKKLSNCLCVGFSVYSGNGINRSLKLAAKIRTIDDKIPLVWGGYHPTLETKQTMENILVDFVIRGQGEIVLLNLLRYFQNPKKNNLRTIKGLSYKQGRSIINNPPSEFVDINKLPPLDFSLYDFVYKSREYIEYVGSRGCPYNCEFCCSSVLSKTKGMKFSQLNIDKILSDLRYIDSHYHPRLVEFLDDNFLFNEERIKEFIDGYKKNGFTFNWTAFCRCDLLAGIDEKILTEMKKINLERIFFGVESGSPEILKQINKKIVVEDVLPSLKKITKYGILADFTFINGFPGEKMSDVIKSIDLRNKLKSISPQSTVRFFVLNPYPGTKTMERCISIGYKKPIKLEDWADFEYHSFKPGWLPKEYADFISTISWASLFDTLTKGTYQGRRFWQRIIFELLKIDSRLRFKYKFFSFAPEFRIVDRYYRRISLG